jgi:hypothetical protein
MQASTSAKRAQTASGPAARSGTCCVGRPALRALAAWPPSPAAAASRPLQRPASSPLCPSMRQGPRRAVLPPAQALPDPLAVGLFFAPGLAALVYAYFKGKGNLTDGLSRLLTEVSQVRVIRPAKPPSCASGAPAQQPRAARTADSQCGRSADPEHPCTAAGRACST